METSFTRSHVSHGGPRLPGDGWHPGSGFGVQRVVPPLFVGWEKSGREGVLELEAPCGDSDRGAGKDCDESLELIPSGTETGGGCSAGGSEESGNPSESLILTALICWESKFTSDWPRFSW